MSKLKQELQLLQVRRVMRYQFAVLVSIIFLGAVIYGVQTEHWFTAVKISAALLLCVALCAPLIYIRAKQRLEAFSKLQ